MSTPSPEDLRALRRDKHDDDPAADMTSDIARLAAGEPLACVIGWIPFLGLRIYLDPRPLIPRPETEWWTEKLITHLREKFDARPFSLLDLCAGSGAIGLAVLHALPNAQVTFAELDPALRKLIQKNARENGISEDRYEIRIGNMFEALPKDSRFDFIATNPPYVPQGRMLDASVTDYEPALALDGGEDGLDLIRRVTEGAKEHLSEGGEVWLECDSTHAEEVAGLFTEAEAVPLVHNDQYGRPRLVVSYWSHG